MVSSSIPGSTSSPNSYLLLRLEERRSVRLSRSPSSCSYRCALAGSCACLAPVRSGVGRLVDRRVVSWLRDHGDTERLRCAPMLAPRSSIQAACSATAQPHYATSSGRRHESARPCASLGPLALQSPPGHRSRDGRCARPRRRAATSNTRPRTSNADRDDQRALNRPRRRRHTGRRILDDTNGRIEGEPTAVEEGRLRDRDRS